MSPFVVFTLFYLLISFGLIYPPTEFISAGFTIQNWFSGILGSESLNFIRYHIKKSMLNLIVYSCLPLVYVILLFLLGYVNELSLLFIGTTLYWKIFAATSITLPLLALFEVKRWTDNNYSKHPIVKNLTKFCNNNSSWEVVASEIENEFRRIEKVCISTNPLSRVVVTENWILKVTPLTIFLTHQSEASLIVKSATNFELSHLNSKETQYLNIEVNSARIEPFIIRINAAHFKDLEDRLARSINVLPNVKFHKSIVEQFLDVFKDTISKNPKYTTNMELDQCIGCLQSRPEVKIQKQCQDTLINNCTSCFCKPMWCVDCMGKWFVSRQDPEHKNQWLSSKCTCPMCRATFCLLDVSLLDEVE
ncbi:E3 ubiquitin-protein ligase TM129 [Sitophilus oryzae]|uniref:E3 ubiquitin-protein ligase TM129 n=1 Tax=Sitophilus oryzae TaxID=7048 RepID=A0A6J2XFY5_SITOR|nr:E3 ubiquitin-protein ligase TM129 [Sitophilus oryzae]